MMTKENENNAITLYIEGTKQHRAQFEYEEADRSELERKVAMLVDLVQRFGEWDMLEESADGPFWKSEILRVLAATKSTADAFIYVKQAEKLEEQANNYEAANGFDKDGVAHWLRQSAWELRAKIK